MMQLRERVKKLRNDHNHIYHLTRSEGVPSVDWGKIIDEKTVSNQDYLLQSFSLYLHLLFWKSSHLPRKANY